MLKNKTSANVRSTVRIDLERLVIACYLTRWRPEVYFLCLKFVHKVNMKSLIVLAISCISSQDCPDQNLAELCLDSCDKVEYYRVYFEYKIT